MEKMVAVYDFMFYSRSEDALVQGARPATLEAITRSDLIPIMESKREIAETDLDDNGFRRSDLPPE